MRTLEHLTETARRAHSFTSFSPEERAESVVNDYSNEIDEDIKNITDLGASSEQVDRYKRGYEEKLKSWLYSQSNTASTMITGGSGFNVERNRKRMRWADNHYAHFRAWREKVLNAYAKDARKQAVIDAGGPLEIAKHKLLELQNSHEYMKRINKGYAAFKSKGLPAIVNMSEEDQKYIVSWAPQYDFVRKPFRLTSNLAMIKATEARIEELSKKEERAQEGNKEKLFEGGKLIFNYEADRLQIFHDQKPEQDKITELKKNGYKWSPFNKCWQRQLTNNALYCLKFLNLPFTV